MRRVGDRRSAVRLEVVGSLWGTLELHRKARICDLSREGALLEYSTPVTPDSVHSVTVEHHGRRLRFDVRVRHVRPGAGPDGLPVYLAGVEFLSRLPEIT